jgi:transcription-repair coupling factor (superfamily II helicase)
MQSSVERIEAGPKGAVLTFKDNKFANPAALIGFIQRQSGAVKLRPDQKLVYLRVWERPQERVQGVHHLMQQIAQMAA